MITPIDPRLTPCDWDPSEGLTRIRRKLVVLVPLNVLLAAWYFGWLCQGGRIGNRVLFGLLILAELFNLSQGTGFWWTVFAAKAPPTPHSHPVSDGVVDVDVLIPVYNEPLEVVAPTVRAAMRLRGARVHVYLLDDKGRDDLAGLARRHGAQYLRRGGNAGAKAGNINSALASTNSPFVAVFDCDHVPHPDFLVETLPMLAEPDVALVQTPQYYANTEGNPIATAAWSQQALFFGIIAQGKAAKGAMFCCGTNFLVRRTALEDVGGFPEDSVTEDLVMSVKLHERHWRTTYLPRVLAQGLGPEDASSYVGQQRRWARGCVAAIPVILRARLTWRQRAQYLLSTSFFLSGWTTLIYMCLPVVRLLTGAQPLSQATADQFLVHFIPYYLMSLGILATAGLGTYTFAAFGLSVTNYWIHIDATLLAILHRSGGFLVTPKQGSGSRQPRSVAPALVTASVLGVVGIGGLIHSTDPGTLNNVVFAAFHIILLMSGAWPALVARDSLVDVQLSDPDGVEADVPALHAGPGGLEMATAGPSRRSAAIGPRNRRPSAGPARGGWRDRLDTADELLPRRTAGVDD